MPILDDLNETDFLNRVWQNEALLMRDALTGYTSPISAEELAGLALEPEVESRLVQHTAGEWQLTHGPFKEHVFRSLPESHWILLVQAVDLWFDEVASLFEHFTILPRWRFDDIMVSYATPGGGTGPHFDHYDVFLVQVSGQRRWRLGGMANGETPLVPGSELRLVERFDEQESWVLNPGDVLYVPPGMVHWGEAVTSSLSYSVGFRSPSLSDMLGDLAIELMAQGLDQNYRDPESLVASEGFLIPDSVIEQVQTQLRSVVDDQALVADWFARYMTQPKYPDLVEATGEQRMARTRWATYNNGDRVDE